MGGELASLAVAFSGFRDADLELRIREAGASVVSTVSASTDVLVVSGAKGVASSKAKRAQALGVAVMQREEFTERYFPRGFFAKLFDTDVKKSEGKCYRTLDNGGRPFRVCANASRFWVHSMRQSDDNDDVADPTYDKLVVPPTPYKRMFVGKSPLNPMTKFSGGHGPRFDGNSMLFLLGDNTYMYVGDCIKTFRAAPGDAVKRYVSPVGNSGVPYPYAEGELHTYLLIEDVRIPNAAIRGIRGDPYDFYYNHECVRQCSGCVEGRSCLEKGRCVTSCRAQSVKRNKALGVAPLRCRMVRKRLW